MKQTLAGKQLVVVGLGVTGLAVARFLAAKGLPFAVVDSRAEPPGRAELAAEFPHIAVAFGDFDCDLVRQAEVLIINPGVGRQTPALAAAEARGCELIGDIELFCREASAPIVAVTGSNGKSTVVSMLADVAKAAGLEAAVGGNLGQPVLSLLSPSVQVYILELSSFQLETTHSLQAACAAVLNVTEDHLDRYPSFAEYAKTKRRIYQGAKQVVYFAQDPETHQLPLSASQAIAVSSGLPASTQYGLGTDAQGRAAIIGHGRVLMGLDQLAVSGRHNALNACFVWAIGQAMGWPDAAITQGLSSFTGLDHRLQRVAEARGIVFINDSKATNVGAAVSALNSLDQPCVLIAGGDAKGSQVTPLTAAIAGRCRAVVLFGRDAALLATAVPEGVRFEHADRLASAFARACELAEPGDCVLLSPACSSWDMYQNYQQRGQEFVQLAQRWCQQ